jgi:hypothetical protein
MSHNGEQLSTDYFRLNSLRNLDTMGTLWPNVTVKAAKTEEIKARVEPLTKHSLQAIAAQERLDVSDIVRRALREFIERHTQRTAPNGYT